MPKYVAIVSLTNGLFFQNEFLLKTKLDEGCCKNMTIKCKPTLLQTLLTYMQIDRERSQVWSISFWLHVRGLTESKNFISLATQDRNPSLLLCVCVCARSTFTMKPISKTNRTQRRRWTARDAEKEGKRGACSNRFSFHIPTTIWITLHISKKHSPLGWRKESLRSSR